MIDECSFRTYHEYRVVLLLAGFVGLITGIVDATVLDWSLKAFIWSGVILLYFIVSVYELSTMYIPKKAFLQSTLLVFTSLIGILSSHHFAWLIISISLGVEIKNPLWLSPNIYVDFYQYTWFMAVLFTIYVLYLVYTKVCSTESPI